MHVSKGISFLRLSMNEQELTWNGIHEIERECISCRGKAAQLTLLIKESAPPSTLPPTQRPYVPICWYTKRSILLKLIC